MVIPKLQLIDAGRQICGELWNVLRRDDFWNRNEQDFYANYEYEGIDHQMWHLCVEFHTVYRTVRESDNSGAHWSVEIDMERSDFRIVSGGIEVYDETTDIYLYTVPLMPEEIDVLNQMKDQAY